MCVDRNNVARCLVKHDYVNLSCYIDDWVLLSVLLLSLCISDAASVNMHSSIDSTSMKKHATAQFTKLPL